MGAQDAISPNGASTDDLTSADVVPWLTINEVAERLGVSLRQAYRLVESGRLRAADFGVNERHLYRVREEWLQEFIESASGESPESGQ